MTATVHLRVALLCGLVLGPARAMGQSFGVAGQGSAAVVTVSGATQQFASAVLPSAGGMADSSLESVALENTLTASALGSITTGQADQTLASVTTTAEAADVNVLGGLITARTVLALATSYANGAAARSEANGATLIGLVVNGVTYGDVVPAPNTRITLPGVGYVVLNEQLPTGDGVTGSGLTVNMIHVYLQSAGGLLGGVTDTGEIIVGSASSAVGS